MFARRKKIFTVPDSTPHPDAEQINTSVSEYFRKYSQGKIENLPTDSRPTVDDQRSPEEMLEDDSKINHLGCDDLDALHEMAAHREEFEAALKDIELTKAQSKAFQDAVKILDDPRASIDEKAEAYEVLRELKDKVTRVRKT